MFTKYLQKLGVQFYHRPLKIAIDSGTETLIFKVFKVTMIKFAFQAFRAINLKLGTDTSLGPGQVYGVHILNLGVTEHNKVNKSSAPWA